MTTIGDNYAVDQYFFKLKNLEFAIANFIEMQQAYLWKHGVDKRAPCHFCDYSMTCEDVSGLSGCRFVFADSIIDIWKEWKRREDNTSQLQDTDKPN